MRWPDYQHMTCADAARTFVESPGRHHQWNLVSKLTPQPVSGRTVQLRGVKRLSHRVNKRCRYKEPSQKLHDSLRMAWRAAKAWSLRLAKPSRIGVAPVLRTLVDPSQRSHARRQWRHLR